MFIEFPSNYQKSLAIAKRNKIIAWFTTILLSFLFLGLVIYQNTFPNWIYDFFGRLSILGAGIGWCILYRYAFSAKDDLILDNLIKELYKRFSFKITYFAEDKNQIFIEGLSDIDKKINEEKIHKIYSFLKKLVGKNPIYLFENKKSIIGIHEYRIVADKKIRKFLAVSQAKLSKINSTFEISKKGFLDKFKHNIELGDRDFDKYLKIGSNLSNEFQIKSDIEKIGKQTILNFMENNGIKIILDKEKIHWVREITEIPKIEYKRRDYIERPNGIELHDEVIQRNVGKFESFLESQISFLSVKENQEVNDF